MRRGYVICGMRWAPGWCAHSIVPIPCGKIRQAAQHVLVRPVLAGQAKQILAFSTLQELQELQQGFEEHAVR